MLLSLITVEGVEFHRVPSLGGRGNRTNCGNYVFLRNLVPEDTKLLAETFSSFGMKRFVSRVFALPWKVAMKKGKVIQVSLNSLYPMINRIRTAFVALLKP